MGAVKSEVVVCSEGGSWSAFIRDVPVAGEGHDRDSAVSDLIGALRDYADSWMARLQFAPNHREGAELAQFVQRADDEQIRRWLSEAESDEG